MSQKVSINRRFPREIRSVPTAEDCLYQRGQHQRLITWPEFVADHTIKVLVTMWACSTSALLGYILF